MFIIIIYYVLQTLADHSQECTGYERVKDFLSGAYRGRGQGEGADAKYASPAQGRAGPWWGRRGCRSVL
jgi:hypothetical protein